MQESDSCFLSPAFSPPFYHHIFLLFLLSSFSPESKGEEYKEALTSSSFLPFFVLPSFTFLCLF